MLKHSIIRSVFIVVLVILLSFQLYGLSIPLYSYLVLLGSFILITGAGSFYIRWNYFIEAKHFNKNKKGLVSLTFDDGPDKITTPKILDLLDAYNAKATFFCIGIKLEENRQLAEEMIRRGHEIGNHSYNHEHKFPLLSVDKITNELERTNQIIEQLTGFLNKLFRPPFGITNPRVAIAVKKSGMEVIGWNVRSYDTVGDNFTKIIERVNRKLKSGAIVLLHDNRENAPQIVEGILQDMKKRNLRSVCVSELLKLNIG